jgi:hypothetical protein
MRFLLRGFLLSTLLLTPLAMGCSSQLSEEETPVIASDEDESETTTSDPENP